MGGIKWNTGHGQVLDPVSRLAFVVRNGPPKYAHSLVLNPRE